MEEYVRDAVMGKPLPGDVRGLVLRPRLVRSEEELAARRAAKKARKLRRESRDRKRPHGRKRGH